MTDKSKKVDLHSSTEIEETVNKGTKIILLVSTDKNTEEMDMDKLAKMMEVMIKKVDRSTEEIKILRVEIKEREDKWEGEKVLMNTRIKQLID